MTNVRLAVLLVTLATIWIPGLVSAQPKGERATVTGEVVEMWCYLEAGDRGPAKKACAKAGNPIALVDAKGRLYVAAGLESHQPAHALLLTRMSERVTVTGTLVKKGGAQMIYIDSVR